MPTFLVKTRHFSCFLWNSSKSPPFWKNPTVPHPQKSVPPFGPKIPQNGKIPPFWPHWIDQTNKPMTGQRNFTKFHNIIIVMWHFDENPTPPPAALLMYGIAWNGNGHTSDIHIVVIYIYSQVEHIKSVKMTT